MKALYSTFSPASFAQERRRRQAVWWFARLQEAEIPAKLLPRWKEWLSDPTNRAVFDEIARINMLLRRMDPQPSALRSPELADGQYNGSQSVHAWTSAQAQRSSERRRSKAARLGLSLAAAAAALVVGLHLVSVQWPLRTTDENMAVMQTGVGEHKDFVLSDHSTISLGAKTMVTAEITGRSRTVVLGRGEALFHVAHDPSRPFRVIAGQGTITAVGTSFNVRHREDDHVIVTVTEGKVDVATFNRHPSGDESTETRDETEEHSRRLARGQELSYDLQGHVSEIRLTDAGPINDWQNGRLRYRGEPLRNVIHDVNRYSSKPIVLGDAAAGELLYSGTVFERSVDDWIAGLPRIYPGVEVTQSDAKHILVRTRPIAASSGLTDERSH